MAGLKRCAIKLCKNTSEDGFSMFTITERRRTKLNWLTLCDLPESTPKHAYICEGHFTKDQTEIIDIYDGTRLKSNAVPTILSPNPPKLFVKQTVGTYIVEGVDEKGNHILKLDPEEPFQQIKLLRSSPVKDASTSEAVVSSTASEDTPPAPETPSFNAQEAKCRMLEEKLSRSNEKVLELQKEVQVLKELRSNYLTNHKKIFNEDQQRLLERADPSTNTVEWTAPTLMKAIRLRVMHSARGYEDFRLNEKMPYPSLVVVNRRLKDFEFRAGSYVNIVKLLDSKISKDDPANARLVCVSFDEMSLKEAIEYDKGLNEYVGFVSPEIARDEAEKLSKANHCLAFMVRGLTVHWKQLLCFLFTGSSIDAACLWKFQEKLIRCLHEHNFYVVSMSSDMGGCNQGLWAHKGIVYNRTQINVSISHPVPSDLEPSLYFSPDVPHVVKNLWAQLLRTNFLVPVAWAQQKGLRSTLVSADHVRSYINAQGTAGIVPVPNLKLNALEPGHFEKMRVPVALSFFSEKLGNALKLAAQSESVTAVPKEAETTAEFILAVCRWWGIMSTRNKVTALANNQKSRDDVAYLYDFTSLIKEVKFLWVKSGSYDNGWKPVQSGIIMASAVVIEIWRTHVLGGKIEYLLPSRFFTSCCENLFTQVRGHGDKHPKPVRMRYILRLVSVAQYLRCPSSASYEDDDEPYYLDFLSEKKIHTFQDLTIDEEEEDEFMDMPAAQFNFLCKQGLYFVAGWVAFQLRGGCSSCDEFLYVEKPLQALPSEFTESIDKGGLSHPSSYTWTVIVFLEDVFLQKGASLLHRKGLKDFLVNYVSGKCAYFKFLLPKCHDFIRMVAKQFLALRLHVLASDFSENRHDLAFSSSSAFQQTAAKALVLSPRGITFKRSQQKSSPLALPSSQSSQKVNVNSISNHVAATTPAPSSTPVRKITQQESLRRTLM